MTGEAIASYKEFGFGA